jgi:hypothetical protein
MLRQHVSSSVYRPSGRSETGSGEVAMDDHTQVPGYSPAASDVTQHRRNVRGGLAVGQTVASVWPNLTGARAPFASLTSGCIRGQ